MKSAPDGPWRDCWSPRRATLRIALVLPGILLLFSCGDFLRILKYGPSDIDDYKVFPSRPLRAAAQPFRFGDRTAEHLLPAAISMNADEPVDLESFIAKSRTVAFLVVHGGDLVYERYFRSFSRESLVQVFSVSKSITALLVGLAIGHGRLQGVTQPVTDLVPELEPAGLDAVTVGHLLQMTSGIDYTESDNPFGQHPALYYGTDMTPALLRFTLDEPPGTRYRYKSGDSQLLGLVLARALAPQTITEFAQRELWDPLGMEYDGSWATDHPGGLEKTFCCLSLRAIDLAKIGRLVARGGDWDGRQIVPADWIAGSRVADTSGGGASLYRNGWWLLPELKGGLMGWGHLGQYLIVLPDSDLVVVRLGESGGEALRDDYARLAVAIGQSLSARVESNR